MTYGFRIYNQDAKIVASSEDRVLAVTDIISLNWSDRVTAWEAYDFVETTDRAGKPNREVWRADGTFHYLYYFRYPSGFTLQNDMMIGLSCPVGSSIWAQYVHRQASAYFYSDAPSLSMVVARPIQANDNAESTHGLVVYGEDGSISYHSDSKVLRILKPLNSSGTLDVGTHTPYFFFPGDQAFRHDPDGTRQVNRIGVRRDTSGTYTRRLLGNNGAITDTLEESRNPYVRAFVGLVDQTLFV